MKKYRNYFTSSSSVLVKDVLSTLLLAGMLVVASTSPFFITNLLKGIKRMNKYPNKKVYDTFYRLKRQGYINFYEKNNQIYIHLTEKGEKRAGWMQIDNLKINRAKKWDKKWRLVMFDISHLKRIYREALRGKLKELGFCLFQKSVWIIPYDCTKEIGILKEFFGLKESEVRLVVAQDIGGDKDFKRIFKLD